MSSLGSMEHQGIRFGVTKEGKRISANEVAALRVKGINVDVFCPVCGEPMTLVRYPNTENEYYFRCDIEHKYKYCRDLAHRPACNFSNEEDLSWLFNDRLDLPTRGNPKGPRGSENPVEGPEGPENPVEGPEGPESPVESLEGPEGPESPVESLEGPEGPESPGGPECFVGPVLKTTVSNLKQLVYSEEYYASDPLKRLPPSGKSIGECIMLLQTNEEMIRALYHLPSRLKPFIGGRFIVEGKTARFQRSLDHKRLDLQTTTIINGRPLTVYIQCRFKKAADMNRVLKKCARMETDKNGIDQIMIPTATILVWSDFNVEESGGKVRLKTTIANSKQIFVLPFDQCPDRSKY